MKLDSWPTFLPPELLNRKAMASNYVSSICKCSVAPTSSWGSRVGTALCVHLHGCCGSQGHGGWWESWSAHRWTTSSCEVMEEYGFNSALCEAGICRSKDLKDDIWKMRHLDLQLKIAHVTKACKKHEMKTAMRYPPWNQNISTWKSMVGRWNLLPC